MWTALTILLTAVFTLACHISLLWFFFRRVALHIQGDANATQAVVDHVLVPILGRKSTQDASGESDESIDCLTMCACGSIRATAGARTNAEFRSQRPDSSWWLSVRQRSQD